MRSFYDVPVWRPYSALPGTKRRYQTAFHQHLGENLLISAFVCRAGGWAAARRSIKWSEDFCLKNQIIKIFEDRLCIK